jgi:hypothetical protein
MSTLKVFELIPEKKAFSNETDSYSPSRVYVDKFKRVWFRFKPALNEHVLAIKERRNENRD